MDLLQVIVAATVWFLNPGFWQAAIMAVLGFGFVIFVHELGHFLVAKWCGVKCEKFYVGFDVPIRLGPIRLPRALFRKQWGETEYGIGIIPFGGYVKMLGQDDNPANAAREAERIRQVQSAEGAPSDGATAADSNSASSSINGGAPVALDPRSYPAKSVGQRMAIISAGVTMNLIFAVIMGMTAYGLGVSYMPAIVGTTSPGLSAWEVGLQPGDQLLQIGRNGKRTEHLRWDKDMMVEILMTGPNKTLDLLVKRQGVAEPIWVQVETSSGLEDLGDRPAIGITSAPDLTIGESEEVGPFLFQAESSPKLQAGDRIRAVNGQAVDDYAALLRELARKVDEPLTLQVDRPADPEDSSGSTDAQSLSVTLPPRAMRSVGLVMEMGPVVSIQKGSPAEKAGLKVGDRIVAINGQRDFDPIKLPEMLRRAAGQPVELTVERKGEEGEQQLTLVPDNPVQYQRDFAPWSPVGAYAIGAAYFVTNRVAAVEPDSPAARQGLQPGDVLTHAVFENLPASAGRRSDEPIEVNLIEQPNAWPTVWERVQWMPEASELKLTYRRSGSHNSVALRPSIESGWHLAERGLLLQMQQRIHRASSPVEAFRLGLRETWEGIRQVGWTLWKLVVGEVSIKKLGGPAMIATVAGIEASYGLSRLLVFLTLLSANLAVLNMLPIPVLDGGHMMFLAYEGIMGKPVNERVAMGLTMLGFSLLMGLMIFVLGMDLFRLTRLGG